MTPAILPPRLSMHAVAYVPQAPRVPDADAETAHAIDVCARYERTTAATVAPRERGGR